MEVPGATRDGRGARSFLVRLVGGSFVLLAAVIALSIAHAWTSMAWLVIPIEAAAAALLVFATASIVVGVYYAWGAHPGHRRAILFVVGITSATLLAHAYVAGVPPAYRGGSASGGVGASFHDDHVNVTSSVTGTTLTVTVMAERHADGQCCTIADPVLDNSSGALSGAGFASPPTLADPLPPGETATGSWTMTKPLTDITVSYHYLDCYSTSSHEYGCIMDEVFYVPEGMGILNGQQCATGPGAPTNCHMEHPPLVPAMLAAGMAVLGEFNSAGWRLFPSLLGAFSIPLLFGIAWKVSGSKRVAMVSAVLLALDVMFFSQSGAAVLDIPEVFFALAAFFAYFAGLRWWKFDKYVVSGILLGAAGLAKETAVFLALALLSYILLFGEGRRTERLYSVMKTTLVVALVFAAGVQVYDSTMAYHAVPTFVQQVEYVISYGSGLTDGCPWACGWKDATLGTYITPFSWLTYYSAVGYFVTSVSVCPSTVAGVCQGGYTYVSVGYYGVTTFLETWTLYVWIPLLAYVLYGYRKASKAQPRIEDFGGDAPPAQPLAGDPPQGTEAPGEVKLARFTLLYFAWGYLPYVALFLAGRVTYPFYFVTAVPAVALGTAYWTTRSWFPRWLLGVYLAFVFLFFLVYFPDKGFLPVWLRVILKH